jgi:alkylation response protein AidB-like acyl-CoA dehydrogenase
MKFELSRDQRDFATTLEALLADAGPTVAARAWARGDHEPGLALWRLLTDMGVPGLLIDGYRVEHVIAMEALGRHAVPGPWIESAAYLASCPEVAETIAKGAVATVVAPPHVPYALDADVAEFVFDASLQPAEAGERVPSVDPVRRLFRVSASGKADAAAFEAAALAASAQLLGAGERMLAESVIYARQRTQFGRQIGSYQAIKHALADVRIALDFVRPLVYAAALDASPVSAAKVAAGDAAWLAARTALQVHGAIGYTREHDLSLWLLRTRGLTSAWGTGAHHRAGLLELLTKDR